VALSFGRFKGGAQLKPHVSILINNYNYAEFVGGAIESALAQTYKNFEVIVVDDGSTDASREIIHRFADRVVPVFKSNGGQSSAFNAGFARASGDILCFLDSDDQFLPTKLKQVVQVLDVQPRQWCFHHLQWTDKNLNPVEMPLNPYESGERDLRSDVHAFTPPATSGLSFSRTLLERILPMPEDIRITSDNYLKLSALALAPGYYIEEQLALQRIHGKNAYTGRRHTALEAEIQMATAIGLRKQCPALRRVWNRMYADGLAMKFRSRLTHGPMDDKKMDYLEGLSAIERVTLCARVGYKVAKHTLSPRANPTS
jgi:glycosyltransferase involved in cell wall biosynthesis